MWLEDNSISLRVRPSFKVADAKTLAALIIALKCAKIFMELGPKSFTNL